MTAITVLRVAFEAGGLIVLWCVFCALDAIREQMATMIEILHRDLNKAYWAKTLKEAGLTMKDVKHEQEQPMEGTL
jgi:hypothetical protein